MTNKETDFRLGDSEYKLMELLWLHEPVSSMNLARLCLDTLGWKKSTVFTMLKRLIEKKAVQNQNAIVTSLINRNQVIRYESEALLAKSFDGSLPDFFAAFLQDRKLTLEEAQRIEQMIKEATQ